MYFFIITLFHSLLHLLYIAFSYFIYFYSFSIFSFSPVLFSFSSLISYDLSISLFTFTFTFTFIFIIFIFIPPFQPERISGGEYTFASDIWSFGLTIFEIALARYPYPYADIAGRGGALGFWDLLELIVQKPAPQLPPDQFSPEFIEFVASSFVKSVGGFFFGVLFFYCVCV